MRLTNEILSAYIDGELPADEATQVALALTRDPDAVRRLDALRRGDAALREAFAWMRPGEIDLTASIAAGMRRAEQSRRLALLVAGALMAATLGFGLGKIAPPRDIRLDPAQGAIADGDLARALDARASSAPGPVRIALTFRAADGRICREFRAPAALEGLACRQGRGWRLAVLASPRVVQGAAGLVDRVAAAIGIGEVLGGGAEPAPPRVR